MAPDDPIDFSDPRDPRAVLARLKAEQPDRFKDDTTPRWSRRAPRSKRRGRPPGVRPNIHRPDPEKFQAIAESAGPPEPLWSRADYANYLQVHESTLDRLKGKGLIAPGIQLTANIKRWRPSVVRRFHAAMEAGASD